MKMFDMETIEKNNNIFISEVIRPWLYTFLREQLLHFGCDLEYDSIFYVHTCFHIYGLISSGESDVKILLCPLDRVGSLGNLIFLVMIELVLFGIAKVYQ